VDHRRAEVRAHHLEVAVEVDAHHHGQPVFLRDQRAHVPGELLGEHGDGPVGEVHAAAALLGLDVDGLALAHVVRDVRHCHPQPVAAGRQRLERHRVIEVARRLGIDGGEGDVAQILAVAQVGLAHHLRHLRGQAGHLGREVLVDVVDGQDLLDLGAGIVGIAQHLQHRDLQRSVGRLGIAEDRRHHRLAGPRAARPAVQGHRPGDARVIGLEVQGLARAHDLPGDLAAAPLEHVQHPPLEAARPHPPLHVHPVSVHRRAAHARGDVDVFGPVVRNHEAVAVGVDLDPSRDHVLLVAFVLSRHSVRATLARRG
jgi:hypothetical protein